MTNSDITLKLIDLSSEFTFTGVAVHNNWHETLNEVEYRLGSSNLEHSPCRIKSATNDELIQTLMEIKNYCIKQTNQDSFKIYKEDYPKYIDAITSAINELKQLDN